MFVFAEFSFHSTQRRKEDCGLSVIGLCADNIEYFVFVHWSQLPPLPQELMVTEGCVLLLHVSSPTWNTFEKAFFNLCSQQISSYVFQSLQCVADNHITVVDHAC